VAGKLVVDAMNYWPPVNGVQEMFEDRRYTSSEIVQRRPARSTVVKTLNHIGYHEMEDDRRPAGSPERRALGVAGDHSGAVDAVAEVIKRIGYDAVRLYSLSAGRLLEPGSPVFCVPPSARTASGPGRRISANDRKHQIEPVITRIGKTRGFATPTKEQFLHEVGPHGALYVGSPQTVAQKI
jgi:lactam utilization protein B